MNSIILLRGLPGAGKSTLASILKDDLTKIFSIDDYFTDENGTYKFDYKQNHLAYQNCIDNCKKAILNSEKKIIIHHTFTLEWEMEPYFALAKEYNYKLFVVTVENRQGFKNTHDISDEQIKKMAEKYKVVLF
ncbi:MAG: ATP-binding protein [Bacteroidetes bacterium]|nr:ATP-binding protein [Bacteroidota bacterium]